MARKGGSRPTGMNGRLFKNAEKENTEPQLGLCIISLVNFLSGLNKRESFNERVS